MEQHTEPIQTLIEKGLTSHQQGKFKEAIVIYEQVLDKVPNNFLVLQLMGAIYGQTKNHQLAIEFLLKAININPQFAPCHNNIGITLQELGRLDEALASYDQAISLKPDYAKAYSNRGNALKELGRLDEALESYDEAIKLMPDYAEAFSNRGNVLKELTRPNEALDSYNRAISLKPDYAEAHSNRGIALQELNLLEEALDSYNRAISLKPDYAEAHYNRGIALQKLEQFNEALASYNKAVSLKPDYAEAYSNRGNTLKKLNLLEEALDSYDQAIRLKPNYAEAHYNRGIALQELRRHDEAIASNNQAIRLKPDYAEAYSNRGIALQELGCLKEALANFNQAINLKPDYAKAHLNYSLALLLDGQLQQGWHEYEWRLKADEVRKTANLRKFLQPLWLGEKSLENKTILIYGEQGLGDTIQFCRYVSLVAKRGAKVILEVQRPLINLLKSLEGACQIISMEDTLPEFDFQCPLLSLPLAFKTTLNTIPPLPRFIASDSDKVQKWRSVLGKKQKISIGLVWSGSTGHKNDHNRSLTLTQLISYLPPQYQYICLQKELREIDKVALAKTPHVQFYGDEIADFTDTAALCELMDLIVSVDTSVAHLAGSLGKQTWILLPRIPDWRWLLERDNTPWYPSVSLYRQEEIGNWDVTLERLKRDLENFHLH